jgi:hypothetical protein
MHPRKSVFQKVTSAIKNVFGGEDAAEPTFEISAPFNFKHTHHVQADPHSSTGFSVSIIVSVSIYATCV